MAYEHQTAGKTEYDKRQLLLELQAKLFGNDERPGFRLAMSRDESVLGAQNIDTKKLTKVMKTLATKMNETSDHY